MKRRLGRSGRGPTGIAMKPMGEDLASRGVCK